MVESDRLAEFVAALGALIERFGGARNPELEAACAANIVSALTETSTDGRSLTPLDVVRIRAGKFAATRLPASLYKEPQTLAALRREILAISRAFVGDHGSLFRDRV